MSSLFEHFSDLPDPRREQGRLHQLTDVVILTVLAVLCGADGWVQVEEFGKAKEEWLKTFLELPNGIPSHDTIGRIFMLLHPGAFEERFREWVLCLGELLDGDVVAIDGKSVRRSKNSASGKAALHLVSAFATRNRLVLGQVACEEKSNEITAIPALLKLLHLKGCIVTIDAMGCQKDIAKRIMDGGGDYVLHLKANQERLHEAVRLFFHDAISTDFDDVPHDYFETFDQGHDRDEVRRVWCTDWVDWLPMKSDWEGLSSLIFVERERTVLGKQTSVEQSVYLCSIPELVAANACHYTREHWGIENSLHWVLDVTFREDESRVRKGHAPQNFATIRKIALQLLRDDTSRKASIKTKQFRCAMDNEFLRKVAGL